MKQHPEIGYRIAVSTPQLEHIAEYILYHHERWDGRGYPKSLSGEEVPLVAIESPSPFYGITLILLTAYEIAKF
nr:HD domain-containing phosphohydrolase [Tissierella creatinophila]